MFHFGWGICFFGGVENVGATIGRPPAWRSNALSGMAFLQGIRARASNARPYNLLAKFFILHRLFRRFCTNLLLLAYLLYYNS